MQKNNIEEKYNFSAAVGLSIPWLMTQTGVYSQKYIIQAEKLVEQLRINQGSREPVIHQPSHIPDHFPPAAEIKIVRCGQQMLLQIICNPAMKIWG